MSHETCDHCDKPLRLCVCSEKRYPPQDPIALGHYYHRHVNALTAERLDGKTEIAEQLAWRDQTIEGLRSELANARALLTELSALYHKEHEQIAPLLAAAARALP